MLTIDILKDARYLLAYCWFSDGGSYTASWKDTIETEKIIALLPKIAWPKSFRSLSLPLFKTEIDFQKVLDLILQTLKRLFFFWGWCFDTLIHPIFLNLSSDLARWIQNSGNFWVIHEESRGNLSYNAKQTLVFKTILMSVHFKIRLRNLQLIQFYSHVQYNISWLCFDLVNGL